MVVSESALTFTRAPPLDVAIVPGRCMALVRVGDPASPPPDVVTLKVNGVMSLGLNPGVSALATFWATTDCRSDRYPSRPLSIANSGIPVGFIARSW